MTRGFIRTTVLPLLIGAVLSQAVAVDVAAADQDGERPRIGLVLSGGGARGAAHIGVLMALERMRIPIDAIAGTSIGAIIGGLYASGVDPERLQRLVESLDWSEILQDSVPREVLTYRRKQDDAEFPIDFELGLNDGRLELPMGLIQGQELGLILRNLTATVADIHDFDALPIPFRAVATDIETGEPYIMSEGDLVRAMLASMSVPGVFAPVVVDGHTLVDGGVTANVPLEAIRQMNVDVIIVVDVGSPLYPADKLDSALDITAQMVRILIRKRTLRQLETLDEDAILIRPDLSDLGPADFAQMGRAIKPGAIAARNAADELRRLSVSAAMYRQYQADLALPRNQTYVFDFVRVIDAGPLSERVLESRLHTEPGEAVTNRELAADVTRLYGLDLYSRVSYRIVRDDGRLGVEFHTELKSWGPNTLQFRLFMQSDFQGATTFNVATRYTRYGVNPLGAEWRIDLQLGTEPYLASEFYQPLGYDSRWFVAPRIRLSQTNLNAFTEGNTVARFRVSRAEFAFDFGRELGRWGEVRFGIFRGIGHATVAVGDPSIPDNDFNTGGLYATFGIDTLDNAQIPHSGSHLTATYLMSRPALGAESNYEVLEVAGSTVWSLGRNSLLVGAEFRTTFGSDGLIQNSYPLGGFLRLSGLERGEISGPHTGLVHLVYYRRTGETGNGLFDIPLYLGASLEAGNAWQSRSEIGFDSLRVNGSLFAGYDTFFGPIFLGVGFGEDDNTNFYLSIGALPR